MDIVEPEVKLMHITPRMAEAWLKTNVKNRPIAKSNLNALIREIKAGHWQVNGEAIKFDNAGHLVDGQHRLTAVVQTNLAIHSLVVFNVLPEAFDTLDQGKVRGIADALALHGKTTAGRLAAGIRCAIMLEKGSIALNDKVSNVEAMEYLTKNPGIVEFANCGIITRRLTTSYVYCGLRYLLAQKHPVESATFFDQFETGVGLSERSPVKVLRDKLTVQQGKVAKLRPLDVLALTIKAWNLFITGRSITKLTWSKGEDFPKIK